MARGKQVTSYVPAAHVEAFEQLLEDRGTTAYLLVAGLIEREMQEAGLMEKPKPKKALFIPQGAPVTVPANAPRRRHARRRPR